MREQAITELFKGMMPEVSMILGECVWQLLVEGEEISSHSIKRRVKMLHSDDAENLAVQIVMNMLSPP